MRMRAGVLSLVMAAVVGAMGVPCPAKADGAKAKIYGVAYVRVKVTDMEKAKKFYGGVLGLKEGGTGCKGVGQVCYSVNGQQHVELVKTAPGTTGSYLAEVGLATNNVFELRSELTAKGIAAGPILHRPDGEKYFEMLDPEKNRLAFVEGAPLEAGSLPAGEISNRLFHAGFVVTDQKKESAFYEGVLGFRLYWKGGFKDDGTDWYEIQAPDGATWIEFMLNIDPKADKKELGIQNHFSLGVAKIKTAEAELKKNGAAGYDGPEAGRDGKWSLDIYDPDGTRVEYMEFVPREKACCTEYAAEHPKE